MVCVREEKVVIDTWSVTERDCSCVCVCICVCTRSLSRIRSIAPPRIHAQLVSLTRSHTHTLIQYPSRPYLPLALPPFPPSPPSLPSARPPSLANPLRQLASATRAAEGEGGDGMTAAIAAAMREFDFDEPVLCVPCLQCNISMSISISPSIYAHI